MRSALTGSNLVVADGWYVDEVSRVRLEWQLERSDPDVVAIAAVPAELPPGSSRRVAAERQALLPASVLAPADGSTVHAALLRPAAEWEVVGDRVDVAGSVVLADSGAAVHNGAAEGRALLAASPLGRPPFPYRPVTLLLGLEDDPRRAEWARELVNDLLAHETEGRIAVPRPAGGLNLTRPCTPTEESVRNLAPDVLVALDPRALESGRRWLGADRSALVIELDPSLETQFELVSWRIGEAQGRLRARIGNGIRADGLAELVRRLCAGPQPLPPSDASPLVAIRQRLQARRSQVDARQRLVVALFGSQSDRRRMVGLSDHSPPGAEVKLRRLGDAVPDVAETADAVLLRRLSDHADALALARRRREAGLRTAVDLSPDDCAFDDRSRLHLADGFRTLADACGLALVSSQAQLDAVRAHGTRAHLLPSPRASARVERLQSTRRTTLRANPRTIGWNTGESTDGAGEELEPVAAALSSLLNAQPGVRVEVVGSRSERACEALGEHVDVTELPGYPPIGTLRGWTVQVWTTARPGFDEVGRAVVDGQLLGVPTLAPATDESALEGLVPPSMAFHLDDVARWEDAIGRLLVDDAEGARRGAEAMALADALYGTEMATASVNRMLGWLEYEVGA